MKVVGLVSGGKDSIFNLHYCVYFGHEIVCLANLVPAEEKELDSFMYQTVGVELVPKIAEAMQLPLFQRTITGCSISPDSNAYEPVPGDETEDLFVLLQDVLLAHPDVTAVSTGAIFSDYQRLRVESVCSRLGLKSLAFLWRQEQSVLLDQMIDSGIDAVLVKTASMGLEKKHLGRSLAQLRSHFNSLESQFGFHVCGEGGEYETVTLDAPLFKKKLCLQKFETVNHGGGAFYLHNAEVTTTAKEPVPFPSLQAYSTLDYYTKSFPFLHDICTFQGTDMKLETSTKHFHAASSTIYPLTEDSFATCLDRISLHVESLEPVDLFRAIDDFLARYSWSFRDIFYVELVVSDMTQFSSINACYARFFPASNPAARYCVETNLPPDVPIRIKLYLTKKARAVTHVQSISTWGMPCIGPYAQSVCFDKEFYTAGVLGLVPHSVSLVDPSPLCKSLNYPSMSPWCGELWMAMRTLNNICSLNNVEMASVGVAIVFVLPNQTPSIRTCSIVIDAVKKYCPQALVIAQCVRRLPTLNPAIEVALFNHGTSAVEGSIPGAIREERKNGIGVAWFDEISPMKEIEEKAVSVWYLPSLTEEAIQAVLPGSSCFPCIELDHPSAVMRVSWFL